MSPTGKLAYHWAVESKELVCDQLSFSFTWEPRKNPLLPTPSDLYSSVPSLPSLFRAHPARRLEPHISSADNPLSGSRTQSTAQDIQSAPATPDGSATPRWMNWSLYVPIGPYSRGGCGQRGKAGNPADPTCWFDSGRFRKFQIG